MSADLERLKGKFSSNFDLAKVVRQHYELQRKLEEAGEEARNYIFFITTALDRFGENNGRFHSYTLDCTVKSLSIPHLPEIYEKVLGNPQSSYKLEFERNHRDYTLTINNLNEKGKGLCVRMSTDDTGRIPRFNFFPLGEGEHQEYYEQTRGIHNNVYAKEILGALILETAGKKLLENSIKQGKLNPSPEALPA